MSVMAKFNVVYDDGSVLSDQVLFTMKHSQMGERDEWLRRFKQTIPLSVGRTTDFNKWIDTFTVVTVPSQDLTFTREEILE